MFFNDAVIYRSYTANDMGRWCHDIDRRNPKNSEENLSQRHFFHNSFNINWPGFESGSQRYAAGF